MSDIKILNVIQGLLQRTKNAFSCLPDNIQAELRKQHKLQNTLEHCIHQGVQAVNEDLLYLQYREELNKIRQKRYIATTVWGGVELESYIINAETYDSAFLKLLDYLELKGYDFGKWVDGEFEPHEDFEFELTEESEINIIN